MRRAVGGLTVAAMLAGGASGCTSTQEKARRLRTPTDDGAFAAAGLHVATVNRDVQVLSADLISDNSGTAVVVRLRNRSARRLTRLPIAIDVRGVHGASVFRNDAAGLEPALTEVGVLQPHETLSWVDDQVTPSAPARSVKVRVGAARGADSVPRIEVGRVRLTQESGAAVASGTVSNHSQVDQGNLVVYVAAHRDGKLVAAGRGLIARLGAHRRGRFTAFLIGRARGATLDLAAPPTSLSRRSTGAPAPKAATS